MNANGLAKLLPYIDGNASRYKTWWQEDLVAGQKIARSLPCAGWKKYPKSAI